MNFEKVEIPGVQSILVLFLFLVYTFRVTISPGQRIKNGDALLHITKRCVIVTTRRGEQCEVVCSKKYCGTRVTCGINKDQQMVIAFSSGVESYPWQIKFVPENPLNIDQIHRTLKQYNDLTLRYVYTSSDVPDQAKVPILSEHVEQQVPAAQNQDVEEKIEDYVNLYTYAVLHDLEPSSTNSNYDEVPPPTPLSSGEDTNVSDVSSVNSYQALLPSPDVIYMPPNFKNSVLETSPTRSISDEASPNPATENLQAINALSADAIHTYENDRRDHASGIFILLPHHVNQAVDAMDLAPGKGRSTSQKKQSNRPPPPEAPDIHRSKSESDLSKEFKQTLSIKQKHTNSNRLQQQDEKVAGEITPPQPPPPIPPPKKDRGKKNSDINANYTYCLEPVIGPKPNISKIVPSVEIPKLYTEGSPSERPLSKIPSKKEATETYDTNYIRALNKKLKQRSSRDCSAKLYQYVHQPSLESHKKVDIRAEQYSGRYSHVHIRKKSEACESECAAITFEQITSIEQTKQHGQHSQYSASRAEKVYIHSLQIFIVV